MDSKISSSLTHKPGGVQTIAPEGLWGGGGGGGGGKIVPRMIAPHITAP